MKCIKLILSIIIYLILGNNIFAQSCCDKNENWLAIASTTDFGAAHLSPLPLHYSPEEKDKMISFNTTDGKEGHAFYIPSDQPTNKVLIIFHEWWGLNDYIKREAESMQKLLGNVDVYAVDLFDGQVATTPEEAQKLTKSLDEKRGQTIIRGLLVKIGRNKEIATLGWCFGGNWSFEATLLAQRQAVGCVMYYGYPEKDEKKIKTLNADVLYIWAAKDKWITRNLVDDFKKSILATGHHFDFYSFDADHAFANPSNPKFDKASASKAQEHTVKFLKEKLRLD